MERIPDDRDNSSISGFAEGPAGTLELGFMVTDIQSFYRDESQEVVRAPERLN
jgi:hypothetical protein